MVCSYRISSIAADTTNTSRIGRLREEAMDKATLHRNAVADLAALAQQRLRVSKCDGNYAALLGEDFEASLLLLDWQWDQRLTQLAPNGFLACIPARDILAFCDSGSVRGSEELRLLVDRVWSGADHLVTRSLFRREQGRWERVVGLTH
jgi:hypothetical protein